VKTEFPTLQSLAPGAEISVQNWDEAKELFLYCSKPVAQKKWRLKPGQRYALLRQTPSQPVKLRLIDPDS
jgi:hypothetical protein